jgi:Tfp pilus assembly protein PilV
MKKYIEFMYTSSAINPSAPKCSGAALPKRLQRRRALTLVEVMVAMLLMALFLLGFLDTFMQSRRLTESSVIQSAATTLVTGLIEQMKMLNYDDGMPIASTDTDQSLDAFDPSNAKAAPYIRVRINQDQMTWLQCVNITVPSVILTAPKSAPQSTSDQSLSAAMKNTIGPLPLSTVSGARSQSLTLDIWVWVEAIKAKDVADAKCVTIVYAYNVNLGRNIKTVIKREVFVRAPFTPLRPPT